MGKGAGNICFKSSTNTTDAEKRGLTATTAETKQEASAPATKDVAPETAADTTAASPVATPSPTTGVAPDAAALAAPETAVLPAVPEPAATSPTAAEPASATPIPPISEFTETVAATAEVVEPVPAVPEAVETVPAVVMTPALKKTKVYIIIYSLYGHIYSLAKEIKAGIDAVEGCEATLFQVAETLPAAILQKMHAPPKPDVPVISAAQLVEADGFVFGFGTRFGSIPAQFKAFFDSTGQLWQEGALVGKPASFFTSSTSPAGGADITIFTSLTQIIPHGMIYVPLGYSYGPDMFDVSNVDAGSPWGSATLTSITGDRQPSGKELGLSKHQGSYFAKIASKLNV